MDERATRMFLATAALAAVAALLAGPANAYLPEGDGVNAVSGQSQERQPAQSVEPGTIPYLSHGIGVGESQFAGQPNVDEQVAVAAARNTQGLDPAIRTAIDARSDDSSAVTPTVPYLSQGVGVDASLFNGQATRGLSGPHAALALNQHAKTAVAPLPHGIQVVLSPPSEQQQSLGLTGDSAATRYPEKVSAATVSSGDDIDWTSFGAGAGLVAMLAAALGGLLLTTRKRHTVGLS